MKPIPTIKDINTNISSDIRSKLNLGIDYLKKTFDAFALVLSGQFYLAYLYLGDIQDNIFPDTATTSDKGGTLERQGTIYLNRPMFPDSIGTFKVSVSGVAGSVLRANLTFKSNDDALNAGQVYILYAEYVLTGTDDIIEISSTGIGVNYNLEVADNLTITEPVIGVDKTVTVTEVVVQPKAGETIDLYRQAILNAIQLEPQGGAVGDYRQWCTDAQGVRLVYPYVRDGAAGFVDVYVEATSADSGGTGIPSDPLLAEVQSVIELDPDITKPLNERGRRPMQAMVTPMSIVRIPVDITITGLSISTPEVKAAILSSITEFLYDVRPFISGADLQRNKNDVLYSGKVQSVVTEALVNGNFFNTLELSVDGTVYTNYQFSLGRIPYLNTLNYSV